MRFWLSSLIATTLVTAIAVDAHAVKPRVVAEVGRQVDNGWELLGVGPEVAVNDSDEVVYVAKIRKGSRVQVAVMRNRERMVWEGKRLADGSLVIDIEDDACPAINRHGAMAVHALILKGGLQRKAVIGRNRAFTWIGRKIGNRTITRWDNPRCAQIDDRGQVAYFAYFSSPNTPGSKRGVFVGNRPVVTVGKIQLDGSQVDSLREDVAVNGSGRIAVSAQLSPSAAAVISKNAVLLRNGDVLLDGSTVRVGFSAGPAINAQRAIATRAEVSGQGAPDPAIVTRNDVVLRPGEPLPDGAAIEFVTNFSRAVIDNAGNVAVRGNVDFDGLFAGGASIVTPKGVVVFVGDLIGGARPLDDLQPPAINGKGNVAFVARLGTQRAVVLGKATKGCRNFLEQGIAVPDGYGAAYDVTSVSGVSRQTIARVRCGFGSAVFQVGTGGPRERINPDAFVWKRGAWQPLRLNGRERDADGWLVGAARADLGFTGSQLRARDRWVLAETCTVDASGSKCGCRDFSCRTRFWQLQVLRRPSPGEVDPQPDLTGLPPPPPPNRPPPAPIPIGG